MATDCINNAGPRKNHVPNSNIAAPLGKESNEEYSNNVRTSGLRPVTLAYL